MRLKFIIIALLLHSFAAFSQQPPTTATSKQKGVADYYKKHVRGVFVKDQDEVISGQILAFRSKGIVFKRSKEGPFYNPKPEYIPISKLQAFVDEMGQPLWGEIPVTKKFDFLKIRKYEAKVGFQYGIGQHPNSYTFSPLVTDSDEYLQNLFSGTNVVGQVGLFLTPHVSVGLNYIRHSTRAEIYSLQPDADPDIIRDDITMQNFMFDVGFHQSVSRLVIFHASANVGGLFYSNQRQLAAETIDIEGVSFSAVFGGGVDFLLGRNVALGFELSYLFGAVKDPKISGSSQTLSGRQSLNRFDMNAGIRFYF